MMSDLSMRADSILQAPLVRTFAAAAILWTCITACGPSSAHEAEGLKPGGKAGETSKGPASPSAPVRDVRTAAVSEAPWQRTLRVTGELAALDEATISVKVPGRIEELDVDVGTRVKKGDLLAAIERRDYELRSQAAVAALQAARARLGLPLEGTDDSIEPGEAALVKLAQAQLDDATKTRDRLVQVAPSGAASQAELETASSNVLVAQARLRDAAEEVQNRRALVSQRRAELAIAQQQLLDTRIVAPFDGFVRERRASIGDYVQAGAAVVTLVRVDPLRLRIEVPELDAAQVKTGQTVRVWITGVDEPREGKVVRTSPSISATNRTLLVEAEVPNASAELRPGSYARAQILVDPSARALGVPVDALVSFAGIDKLFVVEGGKAVERRVTVGRRDDERVEILSGAKAGDVVVLAPGNLQSGTAVRPVEAK